MIRSFKDRGTKDIFDRRKSKAARRTCPESIWRVTQRKLDQLEAAKDLRDLGSPPSNQLEALKGDRKGKHSIRVNQQYRVCFRWTEHGAEEVEVIDYH